MDVEVSMNEGALTLVNAGQPCLRIIFDVKAELKKKKTDWRLELGLGALQAFGLGGEGARATTLLTRRTWRPIEGAEGAGAMIQIGEVMVMVVMVVVMLMLVLFYFCWSWCCGWCCCCCCFCCLYIVLLMMVIMIMVMMVMMLVMVLMMMMMVIVVVVMVMDDDDGGDGGDG